MLFSKRQELVREYKQWLIDESVKLNSEACRIVSILDCPENVMAFLDSKGLLPKEEISQLFILILFPCIIQERIDAYIAEMKIYVDDVLATKIQFVRNGNILRAKNLFIYFIQDHELAVGIKGQQYDYLVEDNHIVLDGLFYKAARSYLYSICNAIITVEDFKILLANKLK